jgi:hypothetical protein
MRTDETVLRYVNRAPNLAMQLEALNHKPEAEDVAAVVVAGWPSEHHGHIRVVLENQGPLPLLNELQAKLLLEDSKKPTLMRLHNPAL